jgi:hypothetical protein
LFTTAQGGTRPDKKVSSPSLEELGKTLIMEQLIEKVQQSTSHRREVIESTSKVTMDLIEQHLIQPTKVHTMIQGFMATLEKDMQNLNDNTTMHEATLEELGILSDHITL